MQVKGVAINSSIKFIKKFYKEYYDVFLNYLADDVREVYSGKINIKGWYELNKFFVDPMLVFSKVANIYDKIEFAKELGRYAADDALKGIYKIYVLIASPYFLMLTSSRLIKVYYKSPNARILKIGNKYVRWEISNFPDMSVFLENRILAFSQRAIEMTNRKNVTYKIEQSITKGADSTIVFFSWD